MTSDLTKTTPIRVAGVGMVSPLAIGAWPTFAALLAGRTVADRLRDLPEDLVPMDLVQLVGGVALARSATIDPAIDLAEAAAREALFNAGIDPLEMQKEDAENGSLLVLIASSKGAVHALTAAALIDPTGQMHQAARSHFPNFTGSRAGTLRVLPPKDAALAVALGPHGYLAHHLQRKLGLPITTTIVAACASGLVALHAARQRLLHDDQIKRVLVIATEASLLPQFVASYQRLGVLAPLHPQKYRPLPLDDSRCGFVLSEMGVAVVLEKISSSPSEPGRPDPGAGALHPQKNLPIHLLETAIAAETFDLIRSDPAMPALQHIAQKLFTSAQSLGKSIDVLHPHATGTPDHDPAELATYLRALNIASSSKNSPQLYASKGAFGHSLGAAGLASFVMACLSAQSHRVPPMPWLKNPVREVNSFSCEKNGCKTHAIFAAGFGGHTAGAVIG